MGRNGLYIDIVLGKKRPKWALDGFKGVKSRVTSNLNALWDRMDHTIWSKMTVYGHFLDWIVGGKRGRRDRARIRYLPVRQSKSDSKMG